VYDSDREKLLATRLEPHDIQSIFGMEKQALIGSVTFGDGFCGHGIILVGRQTTYNHRIEQRFRAQILVPVRRSPLRGIQAYIGFALWIDNQREFRSVAGQIEHFGLYDGQFAKNAKHIRLPQQQIGSEGGVFCVHPFFGLEMAGQDVDGRRQTLEFAPLVVESTN